MQKVTRFTEGKLLGPLFRFSMPILLALFLQAMYGAVDLAIVGQFGDASGVSGVSTGSQIMQTLTGIISGLSMGITVLLGHRIGERKDKEAADTIGAAVCLFAALGAAFTILMLLFARPVAALMNAPAEAFEQTVMYVRICSGGALFIVAYNVLAGIFRGLGDSKLPLVFVGIACCVNIGGDLLLVGALGLDVVGAAVATVLAQVVSVGAALVIIRKRGLPVPFSLANVRPHRREMGQILRMGAPIALQDALTNVSFLIITAILNGLGLVASAAVGISEKVIVFVMLIPIAFMSSVSAFVAQNMGAGKPERARKAMLYAMGTSLIFGVVLFWCSAFHGDVLAGIFLGAGDEAVIAASAAYLRTYSIDCLLVCILFCYMGYFNGSGNTVFVMVQGVTAAFLVRIPLSYGLSRLPGVTLTEIGLAPPAATVCSILLCLLFDWYKRRKARLGAQ